MSIWIFIFLNAVVSVSVDTSTISLANWNFCSVSVLMPVCADSVARSSALVMAPSPISASFPTSVPAASEIPFVFSATSPAFSLTAAAASPMLPRAVLVGSPTSASPCRAVLAESPSPASPCMAVLAVPLSVDRVCMDCSVATTSRCSAINASELSSTPSDFICSRAVFRVSSLSFDCPIALVTSCCFWAKRSTFVGSSFSSFSTSASCVCVFLISLFAFVRALVKPEVSPDSSMVTPRIFAPAIYLPPKKEVISS